MRISSPLLLASASTALALAVMVPLDSAHALEGCEHENPENQDYNIACGATATTTGGTNNIAVGVRATANGGNPTPNGELSATGGNVAVGSYTNASGVEARNVAVGSGSTVQSGAYAVGNNAANVALGTATNASGNDSYNVAIGYGAYAAGDGESRVAIGDSARAANSSTMAVGYDAQANGQAAVALGYGTRADHTGSVAIGNGSITDQDNSVSFGNEGLRRKLVFVADGAIAEDSSEAVTGGQLYATNRRVAALEVGTVVALTAVQEAQEAADLARSEAAAAQADADIALAENVVQDGRLDAIEDASDAQGALIAVAQNTANTARQEAAVAQGTADTAIERNAALGASTARALGGGSQFDPISGAISAPSYSIGGTAYDNVGSALTALDTRIDTAFSIMDVDRREARRGIAAAVALAQAPFPSAPGRTSYTANTAVYRGEWAVSASLSHRLNLDTPLAVSAGVSYAGGKNTAARVGIAGEF